MLEDPVGALVNAARGGVDTIVTIVYPSDPVELATVERMPEWAEAAAATLGTDGPEGPAVPDVALAVGCHPHEASTWDGAAESQLRDLVSRGMVSAIGETGLDFHYDHSPRDVQRQAFRDHLALAQELDLPAIVHLREAHDEGAEILDQEGVPASGAIVHCFSEGPEMAERFLEMGCTISFAGTATFKKAESIRDAARLVPADRLLVETDCPFLAPEPHRGRKNEPAYVLFIAEQLAAARGEDAALLAATTRDNTRRTFGFERSGAADDVRAASQGGTS
jgi:TatD DNase family protein